MELDPWTSEVEGKHFTSTPILVYSEGCAII